MRLRVRRQEFVYSCRARILYDALAGGEPGVPARRRCCHRERGWTLRLRSGQARETPIAPSNLLCGSDGGQSLFDAPLKRLVSVDRSSGVGDGFEAGFQFKVERERPVVRGVRGIGFEVKTAASGFLGTNALDYCPGLSELAGEFENAVDLVAAGEGAAVEQDLASRILLQQEADRKS